MTVPVVDGDPDLLDAPVDWAGDGRLETRVAGSLASAPVRLRRAGNR